MAVCGIHYLGTPTSSAVEIAPFSSIYSRNLNGNFVMTGNTVQTCSSTLGTYASECSSARNFASGIGTNNDHFVMRNLHGSMAQIDSSELFNTSTAQVQLPRNAVVQKAYLFWFGNLETPSQSDFGIAAQSETDRNKVLFARPGDDCSGTQISQCRLTGTVFTESLGGNQDGYYTGYAEVTAKLVDTSNMAWTEINDIQSGIFSVGNIQGSQGIGTSAGWSLLVVYSHPNEEVRHINISAGFGFIAPRSSQHIVVPGIDLPTSGDSESVIGVFGADGDHQTLGDSLTVASGSSSTVITNLANPSNNIMNSSVTQNGVQSSYLNGSQVSRSKNTFGVDVDRFDVINMLPRNATSMRASFTSTGDTYYISAFAVATPVNGAEVKLTKYISNVSQGGSGSNTEVTAGDSLEYSLDVENVGSGSAKAISIRDDFDSVHLENFSTSTAGCLIVTDVLSCSNLGLLNPGDPIKTVKVTAQVKAGTGKIANYATARYNTSTEITSNVVTVDYGKSPADLSLDLHFNPAFIQAGDSATLITHVTNYGPTSDGNPIVKLVIPAGLKPKTSWPTHCSKSGQILTCSGAAFGLSLLAPLEPGRSATLQTNLISSQGPIQYLVSGDVFTSANDGDPNPDNNTAQTILKANHAPTAKSAYIRAVQNGAIVTLDIARYIADRDGDSLHLSYEAPAKAYGSIRLSATTFSFKPNSTWHGTFRFNYRVSDGRGGVARDLITVIVAPANPDGAEPSPSKGCRSFIHFGC